MFPYESLKARAQVYQCDYSLCCPNRVFPLNVQVVAVGSLEVLVRLCAG